MNPLSQLANPETPLRWPTAARALALSIAILLLFLATCILPYLFPHETFVKGASYEVGFNNTAAYIFYILFLWGPVLIVGRLFSVGSAGPLRLDAFNMTRMPSRTVGMVLLMHALLFAGLYLYKGEFVFADAVYHQTLIYRMTLGDVPYLDFASNYGLAMLYPGYLLTRYMSVEAAYGLYFTATYLFGLYLLFLLLATIVADTKSVNLWFLVFGIGFFNPWTALNVTFVRYLLPLVAFGLAVSYLRTGGVRSFAIATLWLAIAILYTFEAGAVALVSIALLVLIALNHDRIIRLVKWLTSRSRTDVQDDVAADNKSAWLGSVPPRVLILRLSAVLMVSFSLCFLAFYEADPSLRALKLYPVTALSYSTGAHNFPVYPSFPFLTFAMVTVVTVAGMLTAVRDGKLAGGEDLAIGGLILALLMERGAFGVAEPTHFAYYGLPIFFLGLVLVGRNEPVRGAKAWLSLCLVIGIAVPLQYYHLRLFAPFVTKRLDGVEHASVPGVGTAGRDSIERTLATIVERIGSDRPYLMFKLDYYSFPVYRKLGLKYPTYCTSLIEVRTYDDIRQFVNQLQSKRAIILAKKTDLLPTAASAHETEPTNLLDLLSGATTPGAPLTGLMLKSEERLYQALRDFIASSYQTELEIDGIVALAPKSSDRVSSNRISIDAAVY